MIKKVESYQTHGGKLFLSEESAIRHEVMERLCQVMPEFQMIRVRLEGQLDAIAAAVGPMVAFKARVPSKPAIVDPLAGNPAEVLRSLAQKTADELGLEVDHEAFDRAAALMADERQCPYNHPDDTRCPACADWENYVHRRPVRAVNG